MDWVKCPVFNYLRLFMRTNQTQSIYYLWTGFTALNERCPYVPFRCATGFMCVINRRINHGIRRHGRLRIQPASAHAGGHRPIRGRLRSNTIDTPSSTSRMLGTARFASLSRPVRKVRASVGPGRTICSAIGFDQLTRKRSAA